MNKRITDIVLDTIHKRNAARSRRYKSTGKTRTEVWPSQTSISVNGAVCGSCMRSLYYKMLGIIGADPDRAMIPKWERGIYIEKWYQDALSSNKYIAEAGHNFRLVGCNVKFKDPTNRVSGEFDGIGILDGVPIGIEFKTIGAFWMGVSETIDGYNATAKESAMLQVMRYLQWTSANYFKISTKVDRCVGCNGTGISLECDDTGEEYGYACDVCNGKGSITKQFANACDPYVEGAMQIKKWRILYWMSGEKFAEYEIELGSSGELIMYYWDRGGDKCRKVYSDITIDRIMERQAKLFEYIDNIELPPRDYAPKNVEKYGIINRITALNRKIGACGNRKSFKRPEDCTTEKIKEDHDYLKVLKAELAIEKKNLKKAYHAWCAKRWLIHPPKFETKKNGKIIPGWSDAKKHVGDWQCRENICPFRLLCNSDWNVSVAEASTSKAE